jgi:hypothetical protein
MNILLVKSLSRSHPVKLNYVFVSFRPFRQKKILDILIDDRGLLLRLFELRNLECYYCLTVFS